MLTNQLSFQLSSNVPLSAQRGPDNKAVLIMHYFLPGERLHADKQRAAISAVSDEDSVRHTEIAH